MLHTLHSHSSFYRRHARAIQILVYLAIVGAASVLAYLDAVAM